MDKYKYPVFEDFWKQVKRPVRGNYGVTSFKEMKNWSEIVFEQARKIKKRVKKDNE